MLSVSDRKVLSLTFKFNLRLNVKKCTQLLIQGYLRVEYTRLSAKYLLFPSAANSFEYTHLLTFL